MKRRISTSVVVFLVISLLIFAPGTAIAVTRTVTNLDDNTTGSLRQVIGISNDGDFINFSVTGTIVLTSGQLLIQKNITISASSPGAITVEHSPSGAVPNFRIFDCTHFSQSGPTVTITNLTIVGGRVSAEGGAGLYNDHGVVTLNNCLFQSNGASGVPGGAIYNDGAAGGTATLTLNFCTFTANSGSDGGAVYNRTDNSGNSDLEVNSCTFNSNTTPGRGGAVYTVNPTNTGPNPVTVLTNCTFYSNSAAGGAAIYHFYADTTARSCTFSKNSTSPSGNGGTLVIGGGGSFKLTNNILDTTAPSPNLVGAVSGDLFYFTSQGYNLSNDDAGGRLTATGDQPNVDPLLDPAGLQNNGGPVQTIALRQGSHALDKGKSPVSTDARGRSRPFNFANISPASGGDNSDIGGFEADDLLQDGLAFIVNTTSDHDPDFCGISDCTLREAINRANTAAGLHDITLPSGGTITLQAVLGELFVQDPVNIHGPGARLLAISGNSANRIFDFESGPSTLSGVTIRDGIGSSTIGGAGAIQGGGAIASGSSLTINNCTFLHNSIAGDSNLIAAGPGGEGRGGAILNNGTLTVSGCTFGSTTKANSNSAAGGAGGATTSGSGSGGLGGAALGGAIYNATFSTLTVANCTFSQNSVSGGRGGNDPNHFGGNGGDAMGGAIFSLGTMTITASTFSGNTATGGAGGTGNNMFNNGGPGKANGGLASQSTTMGIVQNCILAGNQGGNGGGPDVDGTFKSNGYNFIGKNDASSGFTTIGDQTGTSASPIDPILGPLQDNGGQTDTMIPQAGSTAIDAGKAFGLTTDQRGFSRTIGTANVSGGDGTDIGAFETNSAGPSPTPTATPTATPNPTTLANVSTRMRVETGDNALIGGFIVSGTQMKKVIVLATGPSLSQFFSGVLADPVLELYAGNTLLESNDNWVDSPNKQALIDSGFAPANNLESAIIRTLPAGNSQYTAVVRGVNNGTGVGVVQVFDLDRSVDSKLANISTRGIVQTGDNVMIGGFIILGADLQKVIVVALGPSLPVAGNLADPTLELYDVNGTLIKANDNWVDSPDKQAIIDSTVAPSNNLESAIIATLPSNGAQYTAIVRGAGGATGVAVVEVFALN